MNSVHLTGRITKDLELRYTSNNKAACEFTLATNRQVTRDGEKQTDFINCKVYGTQAENLKKYQGKGSLIAVAGEIRVDQWQNEQGENRYKTYVLVSNVEYLSSKPKEEQTVEKTDSEILKDVMEEKNPFEEFGQQIQIDDSDLPF